MFKGCLRGLLGGIKKPILARPPFLPLHPPCLAGPFFSSVPSPASRKIPLPN
jgi:hypothetical protein